MAASINWPDGLNYLVDRDNYTIDPHDNNLRTDFEEGPARVRQRFTTSRALFSVSWTMKSAEFSYFAAFYKYDLRNGKNWFNIPIFISDEYVMREARFNDKYSAANVETFNWRVTAVLELRELPVIDAVLYAYLKVTGGYDEGEHIVDELDYLVNVRYPQIIVGGSL